MLITILFLALQQVAGNCIITEGIGSSFGQIGVTQQKEVETHPSNVTSVYDNKGVLQSIYAFAGSSCDF